MKVSELSAFMAENRTFITEAIENGIYQPQAARGVEIDKASGSKRLLGIPTVIDRTIQYIGIIAGFTDNPDWHCRPFIFLYITCWLFFYNSFN